MRGNEVVDGQPIRVYDNGGKTFDRYTVVFMRETRKVQRRYHSDEHDVYHGCLGMSHNPFHPQGFGQHSECVVGQHLGERIAFTALPEDCQKAVHQDLK